MKQIPISFLCRLFLLTSFIISVSTIRAYDCVVDGVYYNLLEDGAEVVKGNIDYSGSVFIPDSIIYEEKKYRVNGIGKSAFADCKELVEVLLQERKQEGKPRKSATSTNFSPFFVIKEDAFKGCSRLTELIIPAKVRSIGKDAFADCYSLLEVNILQSYYTISSGGGYIKETIYQGLGIIGEGAFRYCTSLSKISFPNSLSIIGENAFQGCSDLVSIKLPSNIKSIGTEAFSGCSGMTSFEISDNFTIIGSRILYGCNNLKVINSTIKEPNPISKDVFDGISDEAVLYVPTGTTTVYKETEGWNSINTILDGFFTGDIFSGNSIEGININFRVINKDKKTAEVYGTYRGAGTGHGGVYYPTEKCDPAVPSNTVGNLTIPQTILGLTITGVGANAFRSCSGLSSVVIPSGVTYIGGSAFCGCSSLTDLYCYAKEVPQIDFNVSDITINTITLHVPTVSVDAYKAAEPWKYFKEIVAIVEAKQGDANGDGMVNAADIVEVINYIMGISSDKFSDTSADINGDGVVNAADIVQIVNIVLE